MPSEVDLTPPEKRPALASTQALIRMSGIILMVAAIVAAFGYLGGWFSSRDLTAKKFVDAFEATDGQHAGFRRNHAKGLCVSGHFESNGNGAAISKAAVLQTGSVDVIGRFSLGGGLPAQADTPGQVRGLGLQFTAGGQVWRTAMINLPVFPFKTPQAFYDRMTASLPDPATGKPDPQKMAAFLAANPATPVALNIIKSTPPASGFGDTIYHGLNAFVFTNSQGATTPVRWVFAPVHMASATTQIAGTGDPNFLFDTLISQIQSRPLQWHLLLIVGQPGDSTNDATLPWPESRQQIDAGTLIIDHVESEDTSATVQLNFDPLVLPAGMAPSDDPLLSARSAVYADSVTRRSGEKKPPSAISPADVDHPRQ